MSTTVNSQMLSSKTIEDYVSLIGILLGAIDSSQLAGIIPGLPGIVVGYVIAAFAKSIIGLGQNPSLKNYEDWLQLAITFLGLLAGLFLGNPQLVLYGTIIGWLVKSLGFLQSGINVEDIVLAIASLVTAAGTYAGKTEIMAAGAFFSVLAKTLPSIGTEGASGTGKTTGP